MGNPNFVHSFGYSDATTILVNWQKNIIQHPYWGKLFLFQNDYAFISLNKFKLLYHLH